VMMIKNPDVRYIPELEHIIEYLLEHLSPGDVLLTLSAGDAVLISDWVLHGLSEHNQTGRLN